MTCQECPRSSTPWEVPREAVLTWHSGRHDERHVCKRCYMRLYMSEKRSAARGDAESE